MQGDRSDDIMERARLVMPGGVNSPVRAFKSIGIPSLLAASAKGAELIDVNNKRYIDYMASWGPLILGHADATVLSALEEAAAKGFSFGLATERECQFAEMLVAEFKSMDQVRLVNSGTEATMSAIRLARGYTKRDGILKFEGCYHGHADYLLVQAGSGLATHHSKDDKAPSSAGVSKDAIATTFVAPFNNLTAATEIMQRQGSKIAAIIVEPIAGNMGVIPPQPGFLEGLRELASKHGALLIMDEVITGFRVAGGGVQERFEVDGDITTLGKIIGGGMPIGAYGARKEIMQQISPEGAVYQAGTLSGSPLAVACGMATLEKLFSWCHPESGKRAYDYLEELGQRLESGLQPLLQANKERLHFQRVGSMFTLFFTSGPIENFSDAAKVDASPQGDFARFYSRLLKKGVLMPPSAFETAFLSLAHTKEHVDRTVEAITETINETF